MELAPGIHLNIPAEVYHSLPYVSNSYLKRLAKCPASAKLPQDETAAMILGRAAHAFTLEGLSVFNAGFAVSPKFDRRKKEDKAAAETFEAENGDKHIINEDDYATILGMHNSIMAHPFAARLLVQGVSEVTIIFDLPINGRTIRCKCRPDRIPYGANTLIDLKTCEDASPEGFRRSCLRFGYAQQAAFYLDGYNLSTGSNDWADTFVFIAVEKSPPYRCEVYRMTSDFVAWGRTQYMQLLETELDCREADSWPAYTEPGIMDLDLPGWLG